MSSSNDSRDSQNLSEGASYAASGGDNSGSPSLSVRSASADDIPISNLGRTIGDTAQSSRAITVVSSSPEQAGIAPTPAFVDPPAPLRDPSLFSGVIERGLPSTLVQESFSTLSEADLDRICKFHKIDKNWFGPILLLPGQTAYDLPRDYEAVYEDYFKSGFNLPVPEPLVRIM